EVSLHLALSERQAVRLLERAQWTLDYPSITARVADGVWGWPHADAVLEELTGARLSAAEQEQVLDLVCARADLRTPHELHQGVRNAVVIVDPQAAARRYEAAHQNRSVGVNASNDGSATLWATGTLTAVEELWAALDAPLGPAEPGDERTLA